MKNPPPLLRVRFAPAGLRRGIAASALVVASVAAGLHAQDAAPAAPAAAPAPAADEAITLSPFVVSSGDDTGYGVRQTVSATRTATNLADLPMSISVVTDQFINDLGAIDLQEALLYENVTTTATDTFTSNTSSSYSMRGFTAATMRNGFLSAGGSTPVSTIAIDRVELVKGPSSLLYGEMDPGGLVNVVSKKPSSTAATSINLWSGTYQDHGGNFDSTGPIDKAGRFTYRLLAMDDTKEALYLDTHSQRKELVGMLGGQLTDTTDLVVEFDFVHNHVDQPGGEAFLIALFTDPLGRGSVRQYLLPSQGGPPANFNYRGVGDYGDGLERYLNAELHQKLGQNWNLRLAFSNIWDSTGSISRNSSALLSTSATLTDTYKHGTTTLQGLQGDLTSSWNLGSNVEWKFLAGFSATRGHTYFLNGTSPITYTKINPLNPATFTTPWPPPAPAPSTFTQATTESYGLYNDGALYTTNSFDIYKRLHVLVGNRLQRTTATAINYLSNTLGEFALNNVSYQGGILYDIASNFGAYASWSQSFNPQNVLLRDPKPLNPATGLPVVGSINDTRAAQPIEGEGHDLGFKLSLLQGKLDFTGAYYDVRRSNEIQTRVIGDSMGNTVDIYDVQSGTEWSQGVEFGMVGSPFKGVDLMVNYNQPFTGILLSDTTTPAYAGKQFQNNPHQQLSFFTKYTFQPQTRLSGLSIGFGGRYWGRFQSFLPTQPQLADLPCYFVADAVAAYHFKIGRMRNSVQLNASNVLDRHFLYNAYWYSGGTSYRVTLGTKF